MRPVDDTQGVIGIRPVGEVYGFAIWVASFVAYAIYVIWAFLPVEKLEQIGFVYYPDKYWSIAIPVYLVVIFLNIVALYVSMNLIITEPLNSKYTIADEYTITMQSQLTKPRKTNIDQMYDIPIDVVNAFLYQQDE